MSSWDDDDDDFDSRYGRHRHGSSGGKTDIGSALKDKAAVTEDGKLELFGKSIDVGGSDIALVLQPFVNTILTQVSLRGAANAGRFGTMAASKIMPLQHASKVGKGLYFTWLYGLPAADVGLGIKNTIQDGFKDIYALREQAEPLLAANNDTDVSLSRALTSKFTVLAHARARVMEKAKHSLFGTIAGAVRAVPNIVMGAYQRQLDEIKDPEAVLKAGVYKGMPDPELKALMKKINVLKSKQIKPGEYAAGIHGNQGNHGKDQEDLITGLFSLSKDPNFLRRLKNPQNEMELRQNLKDLEWKAPALAGLLGKVIDRKLSGKEVPEVAWDKIISLQQYVERHQEPDREKVAVDVKEIFEQHAHDLRRTYKLDGTSFNATAEAIADAIVHEKLNPQALAEILDDKKIVTFGKKDADFGDPADVKEQLEILVSKYSSKLSSKEVYKNAPFTKESLVATYKDISEEEKPFFTMLFPMGVLEHAGVPKEEVAKYRTQARDHFVDELTDRMRLMLDAGREELKKHGVRSKYIDALEATQQAFHSADSDGEISDYMHDNLKDVTRIVRNIETSTKKPGEMWKDFVARKEGAAEELAPKSHAEHAERDAGDESPLRG